MNFSKLKLNEGVATGNNAFAAAEKAQQGAGTSGQIQNDPVRKQSQLKQRAGRDGTPKSGTSIMNDSFDQEAINREKAYRRSKYDWRSELSEAAEPNDNPEHPYVEVMPHWKYKEKEATINALKAGMKDKAKGEGPLQSSVNEEAPARVTLTEDEEFDMIWEKMCGGKVPVYNADKTQAPKENVARRAANRKHDKTKESQKAIQPMKTDAFSGK